MEQPTTIGIDLAKTVFQVHGVNHAAGAARFFEAQAPSATRSWRFSRRLDQGNAWWACEACAGCALLGARADALGHEVQIMPPSHVERRM